jgi:hypothetical protein
MENKYIVDKISKNIILSIDLQKKKENLLNIFNPMNLFDCLYCLQKSNNVKCRLLT